MLFFAEMPGFAQQGPGGEIGSISHNRDTDQIGYSWDYPTPQEAKDRAELEADCQNDCHTIAVYSGCGAMAVDNAGWHYSGYADTEQMAKDKAMSLCNNGGNGCKLLGEVCNSDKPKKKDSADDFWEKEAEEGFAPCAKGKSIKRRFYFPDDFDRCSIWCDKARKWIKEICSECDDLKIESCNCDEVNKPYHAEVVYSCGNETKKLVKSEKVFFNDFARCSVWCPKAIDKIKSRVGDSFKKISCNCNETKKPYYAEVVYSYDADGKKPASDGAGDIEWMKENLNVEPPQSSNSSEKVTSKCHDLPPECERLGKVYTYYAAKKACPAGWTLPYVSDWEELIEKYGGMEAAVKALKSTETEEGRIRWKTPGTNSSGLNFKPVRYGNWNGNLAYWTLDYPGIFGGNVMMFTDGEIYKATIPTKHFMYVRCVKK